jgi:hypothetical protein
MARGDHHQHAIAAQDVVDERDRAVLADGERDQRVGQRDRLAQRQDRAASAARRADAPTSTACSSPRVGDLDGSGHQPSRTSWSRSTSIGTECVRLSGRTSGSSMRSMPSR